MTKLLSGIFWYGALYAACAVVWNNTFDATFFILVGVLATIGGIFAIPTMASVVDGLIAAKDAEQKAADRQLDESIEQSEKRLKSLGIDI